MKMKIEDLLFLLIRLGLNTTTPDKEKLSYFYDLSEGVWQRIIDLSSEQGVIGIVCDGMAVLFDYLKLEQRPTWFVSAVADVAYREHRNEQQISSMLDLCKLWGQEGIKIMILKGQSNGLYYPYPTHRDCGDIDCYLMGNYKKGNQIIKKLGISLDENWEKHSKFLFKGETVENHQFFVQTLDKKWNNAINEELLSLIKGDFDMFPNSSILLPPVQFNGLFLTYHAMEHFTMGNMRLKQILDWAMFVKNNGSKINWPILYEQCKRFKMDKFIIAMNEIVSLKFGVQIKRNVENCEDKLFDKVLSSVFKDDGFIWGINNQGRWEGRLNYVFYVINNKWKFNLAGRSVVKQLWMYVSSYGERNKVF